MKAKYFKELRKVLKYYEVDETEHLFGNFNWKFWPKIILAYNHKNACDRYKKRYNSSHEVRSRETTEQWGEFRVKLLDDPFHFRHIKYY